MSSLWQRFIRASRRILVRIGPLRLARPGTRSERQRAYDQIRTAGEGKTAQPEHRLLALPSTVD
jgi:hypothetical protein